MKVKTKVVIMALIVIVINIVMFSATGMISTMQGKNVKNAILKENDLSEVASIVGYDFEYPSFLESETNVEYSIINNTNVQIENSRFKYCVAKYIADDISIVGDYGKYKIDKTYKSADANNSIVKVRYRVDDNATIVEWYTKELMYGLKMYDYNGYDGINALLTALNINLETMTITDTT